MTTDLGIEDLEDAVEIGVGGFATVYKAFQPRFRRTVAVKLLSTMNLDEVSKERFERECHAMGALSDHPNIVTVYGAGFTADTGRPYLVMAYLAGGSLADRLESQGVLGWDEASKIGVHLAGALETAHRVGVIHRDIKPGNVLMSAYGDAQLTDFGIARISGGHETRSGVITASMAHAPPEVLDGQRPSVLADVYSLGSTTFELLHGTPAFQVDGDESMVPMLRRILTEPPPDLRPRGVPDAVCRVIERAMAKEPEQRQQSAVEFGRELQAARRSLGIDMAKLTVPSDVEAEAGAVEGLAFSPEVHTAICPSCSASLAPGAEFCEACGANVAEVMRGGALPTGYATGPVAGVTQASVAAPGSVTAPISSTGPAPVYPPVVTPVAESSSGTGRGLLVAAIVVLVLVIGAGAAVALLGGRGSEEIGAGEATTTTAGGSGQGGGGDETTSTTGNGPTTTGPNQGSYTPAIERTFIERCAAGSTSRTVCRCVFEELRDTVPFERFFELNEMAKNGESLDGTELADILLDCVDQHGESTDTTSPTIGGLGVGEPG